MILEALAIGATGMQAQQLQLETIANNLANVGTTGFKKSRVSFADVMVRQAESARSTDETARTTADAAPRAGAGVAVASLAKVFDAGELKKTDSPLDLAIAGEGLIEVTLTDGQSAFIRGGSLIVNKDGLLATASGRPLKASIAVPDNAQAITIGRDGSVRIRTANSTTAVDAGQIDVVTFRDAGRLTALGDNLYSANTESGDPVSHRPGEDGAGTLVQGSLEASNVKLVEEMVNLMLTQRAFELDVKVVEAADQMAALVNKIPK